MLGTLEVRRDGVARLVPGGKTSELLVRLALEAGSVVRTERLVEDLWAPTLSTLGATHCSRRSPSCAGRSGNRPMVVSGDGGYTLAVDPSDVDVLAVLSHATAGSLLHDAGDDRAPPSCNVAGQRLHGEVLPAAGDAGLGRAAHDGPRVGTGEARRDPVVGAVGLGEVGEVHRGAGGGGGDERAPGGAVDR